MSTPKLFRKGVVMSNNEHAEWVTIAVYSTGLEADMARQTLDAEGIPALMNSIAPGIFGAAFQGFVTGGITLQVPSPIADEAREVLEDASLLPPSDDERTNTP